MCAGIVIPGARVAQGWNKAGNTRLEQEWSQAISSCVCGVDVTTVSYLKLMPGEVDVGLSFDNNNNRVFVALL